ncbi:MAG: hypothetical protein WD757_06985 [Actinomycetota bacterium]
MRRIAAAALISLVIGIMNPGPAAAACTPGWYEMASTQNPGTNERGFNGIDARTLGDVWAVGSYEDLGGSPQTMIQHFDGTLWSVVTSPNQNSEANVLNAVDAIGELNAWAVGRYSATGNDFPLAMNWDGIDWTIMSPSPAEEGQFNGVSAVAGNAVWAVGSEEGPTKELTLVQRWNGDEWVTFESANPGAIFNRLTDVDMLGPRTGFAVGSYQSGLNPTQPLILVKDHAKWKKMNPPATGNPTTLLGVEVIRKDDVWAVGFFGSVANFRPVTFHYNGKSWSKKEAPSGGSMQAALNDVTARGRRPVWAVGMTDDDTLALRWNGRRWVLTSPPNPGLAENSFDGASIAPSGFVFAAGEKDDGGPAEALAGIFCPG